MNDTHSLASDPYVAAFPENLPFWEAAARHALLIPRCANCGQSHWHPRPHCPHCRSDAVLWEQASGKATIHSYTVIRRPDSAYVLAYVQLEEGPLMMTNIIGAAPEDLRIGMAVRCEFRATAEGRDAPVFRPA